MRARWAGKMTTCNDCADDALGNQGFVERVRAGVARAKASGTKSGKAFGRPRVPAETEQRIRDALATPGRPGFHKIAATFRGSKLGRNLGVGEGACLPSLTFPVSLHRDETGATAANPLGELH
jgi:hypothetical protein